MTDAAFSKSEMMIVAAARELAGQRVCFVGVGLPNIAVNLAQRTVAPDLELVYEAGVFGARPARLPLSIGDPTIVTGATAATSMFELFAFYLQGGLIVDAVVVEPYGAHPSYVQGAYDRDNRFYLEWDAITRDEAAIQAWLADWVLGVGDRAEYLEKLGAERITALRPDPAPSGSVVYGTYR